MQYMCPKSKLVYKYKVVFYVVLHLQIKHIMNILFYDNMQHQYVAY